MQDDRGRGMMNKSGKNANSNTDLLKKNTSCHCCGRTGHWRRKFKFNPGNVLNDETQMNQMQDQVQNGRSQEQVNVNLLPVAPMVQQRTMRNKMQYNEICRQNTLILNFQGMIKS